MKIKCWLIGKGEGYKIKYKVYFFNFVMYFIRVFRRKMGENFGFINFFLLECMMLLINK